MKCPASLSTLTTPRARRDSIRVVGLIRFRRQQTKGGYDGAHAGEQQAEVDAWIVSRGGQRARDGAAASHRDPGRVAARVFAMFDEGASLREIVRRVRVDPGEVRRLHRQWLVSLEAGVRLEAQREREHARRADQAGHTRRLAKLGELLRSAGGRTDDR